MTITRRATLTAFAALPVTAGADDDTGAIEIDAYRRGWREGRTKLLDQIEHEVESIKATRAPEHFSDLASSYKDFLTANELLEKTLHSHDVDDMTAAEFEMLIEPLHRHVESIEERIATAPCLTGQDLAFKVLTALHRDSCLQDGFDGRLIEDARMLAAFSNIVTS